MDELLESLTPETGVETTTENQEVATAPKPVEAEKPEQSKDLQSALAQKEHFRTKLEKVEAELTQLKAKPANPVQGGVDPMAVVKLGKALSNFSEDEVDFIMRNAQDKSPDAIVRACQDEWVKTAIQARRDKVEKSKGFPAPSGATSGEFLEERGVRETARMTDEEYAEYKKKLLAKEAQGAMGI